MKRYFKLMRVHHYIKNFLVFAALACSGQLFQPDKLLMGLAGFAAFCMTSSVVYIVNDIRDREKDRRHPTKCSRPIAAGTVSVKSAWTLAAVLLGMSPVFVLFAARILFHEPITKAKVGSMFLAIFGCVLVSGVLENGSAGNVTPLNILIGIASAFCYGMQVISMRIASNRGYHPLTTTFYSLLSVAIVTFPLANHRAILTYTAAAPVPHWAFLFLQALCVSVLPFLLYNIALSRVESGKASILASAGEPSAATVFGMLIYHEIPSILSLLGLAVVIIALALLCRPERKAGAAD